jgi:hypothetical protein
LLSNIEQSGKELLGPPITPASRLDKELGNYPLGCRSSIREEKVRQQQAIWAFSLDCIDERGFDKGLIFS